MTISQTAESASMVGNKGTVGKMFPTFYSHSRKKLQK